MDDPTIKTKCFFCLTTQTMKLRVVDQFHCGKEYYVCPNCNAANSPIRVNKEKEKE